MKRDITKMVSKCLVYQKMKIEHKKCYGMLQPLEILKWKWERISIDFVMSLPKMQDGHDVIYVNVDRLTKFAHFLPIRVTYPLEKLA